jgi:hypothetical protein
LSDIEEKIEEELTELIETDIAAGSKEQITTIIMKLSFPIPQKLEIIMSFLLTNT